MKFLFCMPLWFSPLRSFQYPHFQTHMYMCVEGVLGTEYIPITTSHTTLPHACHTGFSFQAMLHIFSRWVLYQDYESLCSYLVSPSTLQEPISGSSDSDPLLSSPRSLSYSVLTHHWLTLPVRKIHWAWYFHGPLVCLHHLPHSLLCSSVNSYQINKIEMRLHGEPVAIH